MKTVWKNWAKDPKAILMIVVHIVGSSVYIALNAYVLALISETLIDVSNLSQNMIKLLAICAVQLVLSYAVSYCKRAAIITCIRY